ncbi:hypothetical protein [Pseudomonas sp. TCU-HL1]|uniref:hypothetical protein n=1 Tax=Pseudomonas sp. TCU-HL1 TaxID=1856685 RepID=UPI000855AF54|nr:hypothetical protein THL1_401 [Pseudomonas sp. TCU-HL1]
MHIPRSLTLAALLSLAASPVFAVTLGDVVAAAASGAPTPGWSTTCSMRWPNTAEK